MNIGLIAHDAKKKLMQNFCIAYRGILSKHSLYATGGTGAIISESADLDVFTLDFGRLGEQQIIARIAYNEMDLVIYFAGFRVIVKEAEHLFAFGEFLFGEAGDAGFS